MDTLRFTPTSFTLFCVLQLIATAVTAPPSSTTIHARQQDTLHNANDKLSDRTPFSLRKCCGASQAYNVNTMIGGNNRCVNYSISSTLKSNRKHSFLVKNDDLIPYEEDYDLDIGFPRNCSTDSYLMLESDIMMADRFNLLESGHLVVSHRFWFFDRDDYCIEDFFLDDDFGKAKTVAFVCTVRIRNFPQNAIDNSGRLDLSFFNSALPPYLSNSVGRTIVRKCCDLNEVSFVRDYVTCENKQHYATQFFDDLQTQESNETFFRIGNVLFNCVNLKEAHDFEFKLGGLKITQDLENEWSNYTFSSDNYCLDDFVLNGPDGFTETIVKALVCLDEMLKHDSSEFSGDIGATHDYEADINFTERFDVNTLNESNYEETTPYFASATEPQSDTYNTINRENVPSVTANKCCPFGYILEQEECKSLNAEGEGYLAETYISHALLQYLTNHAAQPILAPNKTLACGYSVFQPLVSSSAYNNFGKVNFGISTDSQMSLSMHFFKENYWDYYVNLQSYCVEVARVRTPRRVYHEPQVYYCNSMTEVSVYRPILLYISSAALLATFIIYFFVPVSGSAKLVTSMGGASSRRVSTLAMMLTGRILLCHVSTLFLTFISLALAQQEYVLPGETACTALGFIIYGASIASFSWLTVYCFDYCRMFRGSFKVSNDVLFMPYSAFGWGLPILAMSVTAIAQFQSTDLGFSSTFHPNMGLLRCWFAGTTSALAYFYAPVSVLLLLNILFFLSLLFNPNLMHCWKRKQKQALRANRNTPKVSEEQQDFKMAVKLFFITGIPWIFEVAAWLPVYLSNGKYSHSPSYIYFFEIGNLLNSLRGIVIFVIFIVLQRDVRRFLWLRLKKFIDRKKHAKTNRRLQTITESQTVSTHRSSLNQSGNPIPSLVTQISTLESEEKIANHELESLEITHL